MAHCGTYRLDDEVGLPGHLADRVQQSGGIGRRHCVHDPAATRRHSAVQYRDDQATGIEDGAAAGSLCAVTVDLNEVGKVLAHGPGGQRRGGKCAFRGLELRAVDAAGESDNGHGRPHRHGVGLPVEPQDRGNLAPKVDPDDGEVDVVVLRQGDQVGREQLPGVGELDPDSTGRAIAVGSGDDVAVG